MLHTEKMFELYQVTKEHLGNCKKEIDTLTEYAIQVSDEIDQSDYKDAIDLTYSSNVASASQRLQSFIADFQNDLELMSEIPFENLRKKEK